MTRLNLERLRRVGVAELSWRVREAGDVVINRMIAAVRPPKWDRRTLAHRLVRIPELDCATVALRTNRWHDAQVALEQYLGRQPARFVIAPHMRDQLSAEVRRRFPTAVADATMRGDRLLAGQYELLGYRDLAFDGRSWHADVVHGKTAPLRFWSQVRFLSPECGDHKVTWEFNRHQHWVELGRAYWLTGDVRYRAECIRQLDSWLSANPPLIGMNWASMLELSFRSLSWIWALNFFAAGAAADDAPWIIDLLLGLDRQLTHVERHLSYYFSPNTHLLGEALALYVAGRSLPLFRASRRREHVGRQVLVQEIQRQIAADGGHCERSAHYHRYTLDFYLLALAVARITEDPVAHVFERACARLGDAARALADDSGILPRLGDDDGGSVFPVTRRRSDDIRDSLAVAAALTGRLDLRVDDPPEEALWLLGHPALSDVKARIDRSPHPPTRGSSSLPATGYYVSRNGRGTHLVVDGGPHGYLNGGHAHADALSLTLTYRGYPLLIDTGTGCYTISPTVRDQFRSTAFHNTVTLNNRSQSLPRGPFHWQHAADATTRRWRANRRFDYFVGSHDGYAPAKHYRHVLMMHDDLLVVADYVGNERSAARASHTVTAHWHLDPSWHVELRGEGGARLGIDNERIDFRAAGGSLEHYRGDHATGLGWYAPVYGRIEPAITLRITAQTDRPHWIVSAFGLDSTNAIAAMTVTPLDADSAWHHSTLVAIERQRSVDRLVIAEPQHDEGSSRWQAIDMDTDARMLFAREVASQVTAFALVDVTTLRSDRHQHMQRHDAKRVPDVFGELLAGTGAIKPERLASDACGLAPARKAS